MKWFSRKISSQSNKAEKELNPLFSGLEGHIRNALMYRGYEDGYSYSDRKDKKLLERCKEHGDFYGGHKDSENMVVLTHPLCLNTYRGLVRGTPLDEEADLYFENLTRFLKECKYHDNISVTILEEPFSYAYFTSGWVEKGAVNNVIFTKYNQGFPVSLFDLDSIRESNLFFGGMFEGACLTQTLACTTLDLGEDVETGPVYAIRDLILRSPEDEPKSLYCEGVELISPENVLSLGEARQKLGLR